MSEVYQFIPPYPIKTAVLLLVFNRLETTKQVFEAIRQVKPSRLYIAADGARADKEHESEKVQCVRDYVMLNIDWECELKTLFRDQNLGCKYAVSGAISWFFENEEQGIILEDDCLPSQSFFWYCEELLERYRDDDSVYLVSGYSRAPDFLELNEDYGFCKYPMIWGWASWSRVWKNYDPELHDWPNQRATLPSSISSYQPTVKFWKTTFEQMFNKEVDTWDYQLSYLVLKKNGKCIVPKLNLITNIGFGADATHTFSPEAEVANNVRYEINIPMLHNLSSDSEKRLNDFYDRYVFSSKTFIGNVIDRFLKSTVGKNIFQ